MKTQKSGKNKHLTIEQRKEIEACLDHGATFKAIAGRIGKDPTTVSYEVKHHRKEHRNQFVRREDGCPILLKAPFVCNGCQKRHSKSGPFVRFLYRAAEAQEEYKVLLTEARGQPPRVKPADLRQALGHRSFLQDLQVHAAPGFRVPDDRLPASYQHFIQPPMAA